MSKPELGDRLLAPLGAGAQKRSATALAGRRPKLSRMPARHPVRLVAHRGAPRSRRENTLPAIIAAHALGASAIEIDVRRTADDVAVLVHDATLGRLWGEPRRVDAMTWCEVARVGNDRDRVPRLDAVLARLDGTGATLVLDCVDPLDAFVAARTVDSAADAHVRVEWCGDPAAMAAVRDVLPDARCWLAWNSLALPTDADLEALRPTVLNLDVALLTPAIVRAGHRLGLEVSCWTVDDPGLAVWAASLGVDSITTNDVLVLQAALDAPPVPPRRRVPEAVVAASAQTVAHRIAYQLVALEREHPLSAVGGSGGGVGGGAQTESASASASSDAELPAALQDAARQAEQFVRGQLRVAFPGHGVTGPAFGVAQGDDYHWYVDPIDGATNLLNGIPWTAVSLVLTRGGRPIVGVVADPWRGRCSRLARVGGAADSTSRSGCRHRTAAHSQAPRCAPSSTARCPAPASLPSWRR